MQNEEENVVDQASDRKSDILWMIKTVIIIVVASFLLTQFVIVNAVIPSGSMENTIMTGDRVFGSRLAYRFGEPERGDIIIFKYPVDEKKLYIKRVIGLPGETVEIRDSKIYIDGSEEALDEAYLPEEWVNGNDGYTFEVPENSYLVLGDNRNVSVDARYWAREAVGVGLADTLDEAQGYTYVAKDKILAKANIVYWPLNHIEILE